MTSNLAISPRQQRVVDFLRDVWNDGDAEACTRYLAAEYTIEHDPGDAWEGRTLDVEGFQARLRISRAPFPDQHFDVIHLSETVEGVSAFWTWRATHAADLPGFPATGQPITMSGATIYRFKGERLSGHWQVADRLGVFQQLQSRR